MNVFEAVAKNLEEKPFIFCKLLGLAKAASSIRNSFPWSRTSTSECQYFLHLSSVLFLFYFLSVPFLNRFINSRLLTCIISDQHRNLPFTSQNALRFLDTSNVNIHVHVSNIPRVRRVLPFII